MTTAPASGPSVRTYLLVWVALLLIVLVEILVTYAHPRAGVQLAALLVLAIAEAGIALAYFMHLRYERAVLVWSLIPGVVFALLMLDQIWPDALRLITLRHGP